MPATAKSAKLSFEAAISELETIVSAMESESLPLEQALDRYQRGLELLKHCQHTLDRAEQRIRVLEGERLHALDDDAEAQQS